MQPGGSSRGGEADDRARDATRGRRDIAEYLLEHNARLDIFAATMLGKLDIVKAAVAAYPNIVHVPGPHGIPLLVHAEKGGPAAKQVLEFLRPLVGQPSPRPQ